MTGNLNQSEYIRYSRHLLIPEIGIEGQKKLKAAFVLIIGTGGLGSPVALYLAAAGIGHIGLVDYDTVEPTNLQRQIIHGNSTLDLPKVESAKARMLDINPHIDVEIYNEPFTSQNAFRIAEAYNLIIDCTDNFPSRYLINDLCVLTGKSYVFAAVYRFDGQISIFNTRTGPCYRCIFPEPPSPGLIPSCDEGGVLGILPGTIGTLQATEAIKIILGIGSPLNSKLMLYNALDMSFDIVRLKKNPGCRICGQNPEIFDLVDYEAFCGFPFHDQNPGSAGEEWDITATELAQRINSEEDLILIDVREPHEIQISKINGSILIPLGEFTTYLNKFEKSQKIILYCRTGTRSRRGIEILHSAGYRNIRNLKGGINAWASEVDPTQPIY